MKGISNSNLFTFLRKHNTPIHGVYPIDKVPSYIWKKPSFIIVVNTSPHFIKYGHFITLIKTKGKAFYIDSLALNQNLIFFEKKMRRKLVTLNTRIQAVSSHFCGGYSILFILFYFKKPSFSLDFYTGTNERKLMGNDYLCAKYIEWCIDNKNGEI